MEKIERPSIKLLLLAFPAALCSAVTSSTYITAIPSLILIIISYFVSFSFKKNSFYSTLACLTIFGMALLIHLLLITDLPTGNGPHVMAASMVVLMVYLWYYQNPKLTGGIIILLSLIVLIFTGNNLDDGKSPYYYFIIALPPFMSLLLFTGGKKYFSTVKVIIFLVFILSIYLLSYFLNKAIFITSDKLNSFLQNTDIFKDYIDKVGITNKFDIESHVKLKNSMKPVIFLNTKTPIDYLRADILTNYSNRIWSPSKYELKPPVKVNLNGVELYSFDKISADQILSSKKVLSGKIELLELNNNFLPLPPLTRAISGTRPNVKQYFIFENTEKENNVNFYTTENNDIPANEISNNETVISDEIKTELQPITKNIISGLKNNLKKAEAIQNYFHKNYTYSLEVEFAPNQDPIVDFIKNRKKGFCVHFASGMVLMLRSTGVPAHIASGYIVSEYSPKYSTYIIRERDAHAWVEVYDEINRRWVTFDPTPVKLMFEYLKQEPQLKDNINIFLKMSFISLKNLFKLFSIESLSKVGSSPFSYLTLFLLLLYFGYKSFTDKEHSDKSNFEIDKDTEKLRKKLFKVLKENNLEFPENMTFGELINDIRNSEIEETKKDILKDVIILYQKYRYTSKRENGEMVNIDNYLENFK